jgi:biotin-(acetyl-CoA carboxylase) ligase
MLKDSKVGGILVESKILESQATVVVGIGINLQHLKTAPYSGIANGIEHVISIEGVAETVWKYLCEFFRSDFSIFRSEYEKILWRRGQNVHFKIQESVSEMKVVGVDASGALIVDRGGKISMQDSGEILFSGEHISEV